MVAFTVDKTLNWVPRVGIFSHTWRDQVEEGELKLSKYLQQISADLLVRAVPGQLLGKVGDPLTGVGQRLRARDQLPLRPLPTTDQLAGGRIEGVEAFFQTLHSDLRCAIK